MKENKQTALERKQEKARNLKKDTRGLSTVEYLILLVVIAVASIGIWNKIGGKVVEHANSSKDELGKVKAEGTP